MFEQEDRAGRVLLEYGLLEQRVPGLVPLLQVGAGLDQGSQDVPVLGRQGQAERALGIGVLGGQQLGRQRLAGKQGPQCPDAAVRDGQVEAGVADEAAAGQQAGTALEEAPTDLGQTRAGRLVQGRAAVPVT